MAAHGEEASTTSGAWGAFAKAVEGSASLLGDGVAIRALREGEEHGTASYERTLERENLDPEARRAIESTILPDQRRHADEIERILRAT